MDKQETKDNLTYDDLVRKVIRCAKERHVHSGENLYKVFALAIAECIDNDEDMWTIIHHNCHDVYKAFYGGSLEEYLSAPYDRFLSDCRNELLLSQVGIIRR